jgi:hypothetical protein
LALLGLRRRQAPLPSVPEDPDPGRDQPLEEPVRTEDLVVTLAIVSILAILSFQKICDVALWALGWN